jgi:ketosteroid isomerase-like protein
LQYHDPELAKEEEEIFEHFKAFSTFCNVDCLTNPDKGKEFYDLDDAMYFDLMGPVPRGGFEKHYDIITPYLADATSTFEDLEIVAVSKTFGYSTMIQRMHGKTAEGDPFDFRFRLTSLLRKVGGKWKYVHEHFSFPIDMKTQKGDLTSGKSSDSGELYIKIVGK